MAGKRLHGSKPHWPWSRPALTVSARKATVD